MEKDCTELKFQDKPGAGTTEGPTTPGDPGEFFWNFWEDFRDVLYRECVKMMKGTGEDARDALGTVMITALERFPRHAPGIRNLKGWLVRLTRNVCIDILRKNKKESLDIENTTKIRDLIEEMENGGTYAESIADTLEREELLNTIFLSIKKLPERLREPAVLRFFLKMPHREIARYCNISAANSRKRIQQARAILFNELRETHEDIDFYLLPGKNKRDSTPSSTLVEAAREVEVILQRELHEIKSTYPGSHLVQLRLPSGIEKSILVFFEGNPYRQGGGMQRLRDYVKRYPGGWKKRLELAKLQYALGNWDQAEEEFLQVLKKRPHSLEAWLYLAGMLMGREQEEKAAATLEAALPFARKEATRHHIAGMIELCRNRFEKALAAFKLASTLEKNNGAHRQKIALAYLLADRPLEAREAFTSTLNLNPYDLLSLTHSRDCLVTLGQLAKAEEYMNRALEIYPHDILALALNVHQRCRRGLTRYEDGTITRRLVRKMKALAPQAVEVYESQAIYHFYRGEFRKGLELLAGFTRQRVNSPYGWYYYGCWLYRSGFYPEAAQAVLKAYDGYKKNPRMNDKICEILAQAGLTNQLKDIIREMLHRYPDHWSTCSSAALALVTLPGESQRACELSARAVEIQPRLPQSYFRRGRVLGMSGKPGEAIDTLLKGWELLAEDDAGLQSAPAAWLLAQNYKTLGHDVQAGTWREETIARAEKLKKFFPAEAYYWEGNALYESENFSAATRALQKSLSLQLFYPLRRKAKSILNRCRAAGK
jgi:RNA polymerase sigma factor (sigma-70 family)